MLSGIRSSSNRRCFAFTSRVLALAMALDALVSIHGVHASPSDVFSIGAPAIGAAAPKTADIQAGDASVSTQTGALQYSYPIAVPPGRNGMRPSLSLGYSSQAPIYGGIAAGWSLAVPIISLDTTKGRLLQQASSSSAKTYASSMAGGRPLVAINATVTGVAQVYAAQSDSTFTRYELMTSGAGVTYIWRALTTDGMTYTFGDLHNRDATVYGTSACTTVSDEWAPLTRTVDSFGNEVNYYWEQGASGECRLIDVTWGANTNTGAGLADFARVQLSYSLPTDSNCPSGTYIGSATSWRSGTKIVTGASQLDTITVTAFEPGGSTVHTRVVSLSYQAPTGVDPSNSCTSAHSAYRTLYSISEMASGVDSPSVTLPAVKFSYGSAQFGTGNLAWNTSSLTHPPWAADYTLPYNLGWGYRFDGSTQDSGHWPTVESMLVDVDGDGLPDRLASEPTNDSSGRMRCHAVWYRNLGGFSFDQTARDIAMPTLKWANTTSTQCTYSGALQPNTRSSVHEEGCALNYQRTNYINSDANNSHTGSCPDGSECGSSPDPAYCIGAASSSNSRGTDCRKTPTVGPTYLAFRWIDFDGDGKIDLVASPASGSAYNLQWGWGANGCGAPAAEPQIFGSFPLCPMTPFTSGGSGAYTMCAGMYPWIVYYNHGQGQFGQASSDPLSPLPDTIQYEPIPLEADTGDASLLSSPAGSRSGPVDIDGDGHDDGVSIDYSSAAWGVYRFDTAYGTHKPRSGSQPFSFAGASGYQTLSATAFKVYGNYAYPVSSAGLLDLNGDGLADRWSSTSADGYATASVEINDGVELREPPEGSLTIRPGNDGAVCPDPNTSCIISGSGNYPVRAYRWDSSRTIDLDLDGRVDVMKLETHQDGSPYVPPIPDSYLNQGGGFNTPVGAVGNVRGLLHSIVASDVANFPAYTWEIRSDMIDLDGDGIPEGVDFGDGFGPSSAMALTHVTTPTQPPRLLVGIDNGRGAKTDVSYAAISNSNVVLRDAGIVMPGAEWVVHSVTTTDNLPTTSSTVSTTSYVYKNPHFSADDQGRFGFRGFDEVTTTGASGAQTVERYKYDVDWSGRLHTTLLMPAASDPSVTVTGEVRSISETNWDKRFPHCVVVGACPITTYHATQVDHWTCKNGQTETTCRDPGSAAAFTRTVPTIAGYTGSIESHVSVYKEISARLQTSTAAQDGDRITDTSYILVDDDSNFRLLPESVTKSVVQGGSPVMYAKTSHDFDSNHLVALTDNVWFDNSATPTIATTRRAYDMSTGNVIQRWKPKQNAAASGSTTYDYDSRKLFVVAEHLEPATSGATSEELDFTYEYGTGTKLETQGPNIAPCFYYQQGCPTGTPPKEDHRIRVDGLGRAIERYDVFMNYGGDHYIPLLVETNAYHDAAPSYAEHQLAVAGALDYANEPTYFTHDRTDVDGHGRPIKKTSYSTGTAGLPASGNADAISTFVYSNDGTLASVTMPDPSANNTSAVTYTYTYDSLGRPTGIRRPDSSSDPSGVDMSYDGLFATSQEHVGAAGGVAASTTTTKDVFGRLVRVDEVAGTATTATTEYTYDAADNVIQVLDPEEVTTTMAHDLAGHRTQITRNGRSWSYAYDLNGNVTSQTVPGYASDQHDIANYTTTIAYDDLDRPTSKIIGQRNLSTADQTLFGAGTEQFQYDAGPGYGNFTGRLWAWRSYAPGGSSPITFKAPTYSAQGQLQLDYQYTSGIDGGPSLARSVNFFHSVGGAINAEYCGDAVGAGTVFTYKETHFDARGLPWSAIVVPDMYAEQLPYFNIVATRNVAGVVTKTQPSGPFYGAPGSGGWPAVEGDWTFDKLGRVASASMLVGSTQVARQDLQYNGNDDPNTVDHYLGSDHKQFGYTFDARHQLTSVAENTTTSSSYFSASYGYRPSGRLMSAMENAASATGGEVQNRDVDYSYTPPATTPVRASDAEEVWSLTNGMSTFASYDYDAAGNEVVRCMGAITYGATPDADTCSGESMRYVYDGKDQLRRATHYNASGSVTGSEEYWYGMSGDRMIALKRDAAGNKTEMIWWIDDVEAHYDASGTVTHIYSYLHFGGITTRVDRTDDKVVHLEYELSGLGGGTIAAVDQSSGNVNASFRYAPFGEVIEAQDGGGLEGLSSHRRRWNDKFVDEISGLAYYGARFYDKTSLTWTQGDPLYRFAPDARWTAPRRGNLYTFSLNNPLRFVDPDGLDTGPSMSSYKSEMDVYNEDRAAKEAEAGDGDTKTNKDRERERREYIPVYGGSGFGRFDCDSNPNCLHEDGDPGQPGTPIGVFDDFTDMAAHAAASDREANSSIMSHATGSVADALMSAWVDIVWDRALCPVCGLKKDYGDLSGANGKTRQGMAIASIALGVAGELFEAVTSAGGASTTAEGSTGFLGRNGFELQNMQTVRNAPATIAGRGFSGHALDQMQNRGIMPSVVENAIQTGTPFATKSAGTSGFYDSANKVRVILNSQSGNVVTVIRGAP